MKLKAIASLVMVSMLGMSSAVFAQPHGQDDQGHDHGQGHDRGHAYGHDSHRPASYHDAYSGREGGPIPHNDWHKGDRLPAEYRDRNYEVDDWHSHGLSAPPRGYHWVGVNGDYVLAAVATGVIASVLISGH